MSKNALKTIDEFDDVEEIELAEDLEDMDQDEVGLKVVPELEEIDATPPTGTSKRKTKLSTEVDYEFIGSKEESAETRSVASRATLRSQMERDTDAFLNQGGQIQEIEPNVMADPPRKPVSNYGSRPI